VYGQCIVADYNTVYKEKCAKEFMKLKDCYLVRSSPRFPLCGHTILPRSRLRQKREGGSIS
jgi:hypothetical protein